MLLIIVLIAVISVIKYKDSDKTHVTTVSAEVKAVTDTYTETGTLGSGDKNQIVAEVSGKIISVEAELNQRVNKGDVLFRIDSSDFDYQRFQAQSAVKGYEAQIEKSRAGRVLATTPTEYLQGLKEQLDAAESALDAARTNYDATQKLYDAGTLSKLELDSKKAAFDAAQSTYDRAQTSYNKSNDTFKNLKNLGINENNIDNSFFDSEERQLRAQIDAQNSTISHINDMIGKCVVRAQSSGIVTSLPVKEMSNIQTGQVAAVIMDASEGQMASEAEADVLTTVAPYLNIGDHVEVILTLRGSEEKYTGKISDIYDYAQQGTSALGLDEYRVHVKVLMDAGQKLEGKDGYGVNMKFKVFDSKNSLVIPSSAVFKDGDEYFVYIIKDGKAVKKKIEITYISSSYTVVKSGLSKGDKVIDHIDNEGIYDGAEVEVDN